MINLADTILENKPFPHLVKTKAIDDDLLIKIQEEILQIPNEDFDILDNYFETKYILRDKFNYPTLCSKLMEYITSEKFISELSYIFGIKIYNDIDRNFWGIHKFKNNDRLDIHLDAGIYHKNNKRKAITLGIYISKNWTEKNKGFLELWSGDECTKENYKLDKCEVRIPPFFNTLVVFMNTSNSWHGSPEPTICDENSTRIFLTCSYLTDEPCNIKNMDHQNKKALFILHPDEEYNNEKFNAIKKRSDPETCNEFFRQY